MGAIKENLRKVSKEDTFSTLEVKNMLGLDDKEIRQLCKRGRISLKKDVHTDRTFFLRDDVEMLKHLKSLHIKTSEIESRKSLHNLSNRANRSLEAQSPISPNPIRMISRPNMQVPPMNALINPTDNIASSDVEMKLLLKNLVASQENVVTRLTKVLDEKLEGMDEVVVELIKCKTENEKLQQQINKLTKENYAIKSRMAAYKPVGFGLYIKKQEDEIYL